MYKMQSVSSISANNVDLNHWQGVFRLSMCHLTTEKLIDHFD